MAKGNRSKYGTVEKLGVQEDYAQLSKHRSCWIHAVMHLCSHKKQMGEKITRQQADELYSLESISPCFLRTTPFPCRKRSTGRNKQKCKIMEVVKESKKLDSGAFDLYYEILWGSFSEDKKTSFTYLDSLWFNLYTRKSHKEKVLKWIKRKRIFSRKYVIVPIVCWGHWSLLIFCHFGENHEQTTNAPCMLLLDSLEKADPGRIEPDIRKFVLDIYQSEDRDKNKELVSQIPLLVPKVPQQRNGDECGHFVLYFISLFVNEAPENFSTQGYPYFMKRDWFTPESLDRFFVDLDSSSSHLTGFH